MDERAEMLAAKRLIDGCHVEAVDRPLPRDLNTEILKKLNASDYWDGAVLRHENRTFVAYKLHEHSIALSTSTARDLTVFPYGWCLDTGAVLTLTLRDKYQKQRGGTLAHARVFVSQDDPALLHLENGRFEVLMYAVDKLMGHFSVEFAPGEAEMEVRKQCWNVLNHSASVRACREATFLKTLAAFTSDAAYLRPVDKLRIGWAITYTNTLHKFAKVRKTVLERFDIEKYSIAELPPAVKQFFEECRASQFDVETVSKFACALFTSTEALLEFAAAAYPFLQPQSGGIPDLPGIDQMVIELGLCDPVVTASGRKVPWVGGKERGFGYFEPAADEFPSWFDAASYWDRLPHNVPYWALGILVSPGDIPIERLERPETWKTFPKAERPDESTAVANTLIDEGLANKQWVIPQRALVQLPVGPFTHFEVTEFGRDVFFVGRTNRGEFAIFNYETDTKYLAAGPLCYYGYYDPENSSATEAALRLLFAAVIRDFWVVEQREAVFAAKSPKHLQGVRIREAEDGTPRVVYLPRVRYKEKPSPSNCAEQLEHKLRAAHFVAPHLRRADTASDLQLRLAKRYGFDVPDGYTFVKPHERGKQARGIIYRSRSALQTLFRVDGTTGGTKPDWFKFEKDVQRLMENLGFDVGHKAASRSGDKGVDIYATKGADIDLVNWVIQCKCYRADHPVGLDKIRELHGVVCCHPAGTRGMLVTTSYFTKGAHSLAAELNIRLMSGEEFLGRLASSA